MFTGFVPNTLNLNISIGSIITGSFGFNGKGASTPSSDTGSHTLLPTRTLLPNAIDNISAVLVDGTTYDVTSLTLSMTNNNRNREQVGTLGPISIGSGTMGVTGNIQAYLNDETEIDKYWAGTAGAIAFIVEDSSGNGYIFDMPQVRYTSGQAVASGINTDVIADFGYSAYRDGTYDNTLRISRFTA